MNNRTQRDRQATTRLALIVVPLVGSIVFALSSLFGKLIGNETWQIVMQVASGFMGTLGLLVGCVTLIFQLTRRQINLKNVIIFGCLYILATFVFLGSCVVLIET
jgi:drug/metabolite transporter (DMT)-like permease